MCAFKKNAVQWKKKKKKKKKAMNLCWNLSTGSSFPESDNSTPCNYISTPIKGNKNELVLSLSIYIFLCCKLSLSERRTRFVPFTYNCYTFAVNTN